MSKRRRTPEQAWRDAIKRLEGPTATGRALNISHAAVSKAKRCPITRVLTIERLTGIPRHELRPDIYPPGKAA